MGIQINGNTNNINAGIGSLSIEDIHELDLTGIATASNFKTGSSNLHSTGLTVGNALVHSTGINVGTGATVHCPATNVLTFGTNSNERLRIASNGKITHTNFDGVGFTMSGTGDPTFQISDADGTNQYVQLAHNGGDSYIVTRNNTSHGEFLVYSQNGSDTLPRIKIGSDGTWSKYLNSSSTVQAAFGGTGQINGITGLPSMAGSPLVVGRDTGSLRSAFFGGHLNFTSGYGIQGNEFSVYGNTSGLYLKTNVSGDAIIFQTHNGSSVGERVRIDSSGRVLIGTTDPGGGNADDLTVATSGNTGITIRSGTSNTGNIFFSDATSGAAQYAGAIEFHHSDNSLRLNVGNTNYFRIASNGQITTRGAQGTSFNNAGTGDFGSFLTVNGGHTANQWGILSLEGNTSANGYAVGAIQFINQNNANGSSGANSQSRLLAKIDVSSVTSDSNAGDDSGGVFKIFTKPEASQPAERFRIASNGKFGLNRSAPQYAMHLSPADGETRIDLHMTNSTTGHNNNDGVQFGYQNSAGAYIWNFENTPIYFGTGNTERFNIDSSGRVTKPYTPGFLAYHYGHDINYGPNATLVYPFTTFNTGNHYNTSNSTFTAPVAGRYLFSANANGNYTSGYSGIPRAYWKINGSNVGNNIHLRGSDATHDGLEQRSQTVIFNLAANDTVKIVVGQNQWDLFGANSFTGYLIG